MENELIKALEENNKTLESIYVLNIEKLDENNKKLIIHQVSINANKIKSLQDGKD